MAFLMNSSPSKASVTPSTWNVVFVINDVYNNDGVKKYWEFTYVGFLVFGVSCYSNGCRYSVFGVLLAFENDRRCAPFLFKWSITNYYCCPLLNFHMDVSLWYEFGYILGSPCVFFWVVPLFVHVLAYSCEFDNFCTYLLWKCGCSIFWGGGGVRTLYFLNLMWLARTFHQRRVWKDIHPRGVILRIMSWDFENTHPVGGGTR